MIFIILLILKIYAIFRYDFIKFISLIRMIKHYNITVSGKVQGVWYRKSTLDKAQELGINGFVKNLPDGSVYIEAEGDKNQLQSLLDWCRTGPEFAKVDHISFKEASIQYFTLFEIIR